MMPLTTRKYGQLESLNYIIKIALTQKKYTKIQIGYRISLKSYQSRPFSLLPFDIQSLRYNNLEDQAILTNVYDS